jgi:hypothetical protein
VKLDLIVRFLPTDPLVTNLVAELDAIARNPQIPRIPEGLDREFSKEVDYPSEPSASGTITISLPTTNSPFGGTYINLTKPYRDFLKTFAPNLINGSITDSSGRDDIEYLASPLVEIELTSSISNRTSSARLRNPTGSEGDLKIVFGALAGPAYLMYGVHSHDIFMRWIFEEVKRERWEGKGTIVGVTDLAKAHVTMQFVREGGLGGVEHDRDRDPAVQPQAINLWFGTYQVGLTLGVEERDGTFHVNLPDTEYLLKTKEGIQLPQPF